MGILQIVGFDEKPKAVHIRYKLVRKAVPVILWSGPGSPPDDAKEHSDGKASMNWPWHESVRSVRSVVARYGHHQACLGRGG